MAFTCTVSRGGWGGAMTGLAVAGALHDLAPEGFDLGGGHAAEVVVEGFPAFELLAVDEEGVRPRERIPVLVEVVEQLELAVDEARRAVFPFLDEAGDEVVDEFRGGGVVADDDEAGRNGDSFLPPQLERLGVVAVERFERRLEASWKSERVEPLGLATPL